MCVMCGCGASGDDDMEEDLHHHSHEHSHDHGACHAHEHSHEQGHEHDHQHAHGAGAPPLGAIHAHGVDKARIVQIEEDILAVNNRFAAGNRHALQARRVAAFNLMSSPGSGKTTLLARTLAAKRFPAAVIEGDQSTDIDAERLRAVGAKAVQINTGRGCHLDAHSVGHALEDLGLESGAFDGGVLFIENVGNLVCPSAFDLGEEAKIVLLSTTEGEDKPLKYPDIFRAAKLMILTKSDLLPYVPFNAEACFANARRINPAIEGITLSATSGEGMDSWFAWIERHRAGHGG